MLIILLDLHNNLLSHLTDISQMRKLSLGDVAPLRRPANKWQSQNLALSMSKSKILTTMSSPVIMPLFN